MSLDLEARRKRIGGSEVAALFGADEFGRDQFSVWCSKTGGERPEPTLRMAMGHLLERGVLNVYEYLTGRAVEHHDRTVLDPNRIYMAATPDGFCTTERRGVDAKLVHWDQRKNWGDTADEIPQRVIMQAWWYMAAFDYDVWDICALVGLEDPRVYTIERDREAERAMLDYVERWHAKYILGDEMPPMGHNKDAARWLQRMYPDDNRPSLRNADEEETKLLIEYVATRVILNDLEDRREDLETRIKAAIKDQEGLVWEEGKFTWRRTKDTTKTQWESMARGLLNQYVATEQERSQLLEFYTTPKPGYRKIRIDHPALRNREQARNEAEVSA